MNRHSVITDDRSSTLYVPELKQHYHSTHGAVQESRHVFIEAGLHQFSETKNPISILEIGFGTGLNPLLTLLEADLMAIEVSFTTLEKYPLSPEEVLELNYHELLNSERAELLLSKMHEVAWEESADITSEFSFLKKQIDFRKFKAKEAFDLIYFDAFAPGAQPDLWTKDIFQNMYDSLRSEGMLVTYCSKGDVRRNMMSAGFHVDKIPGPPGKREMVRASKPSSI